MGYELDGLGSIPGKGQIFFSITSRLALEQSIQWVLEALSLGIKQSQCEAYH
jgi:hypothetical protein